jgi:hypothetical protein
MGAMARVGGCAAVALALVLSAVAMSAPAAAQSALLDPLDSHVALGREGARQDVTRQRIVRSGDTVATDQSGRAVITYADGSTATLDPSSELTIEFVRTTAGDYVVRVQQTIGRVWYAIAQTLGSGGRYEVRSAAMAAVIRAGSDVYVTVGDDGTTTVTTVTGSVETSAGGDTVTVLAGTSTTVPGPGQTPAPLATPSASPAPAAPESPAKAAFVAPLATASPTPAPAPTGSSSPGAAPKLATSSTATPAAATGPAQLTVPLLTSPLVGPNSLPLPAPLPVRTKDLYAPHNDAPGQPLLPPFGRSK